jgi:hypothetical protein
MTPNSSACASFTKGFAVPTVLALTLILSILASTLLTQMKQNEPMNRDVGSRLQAKYLALGAIQIALLKIKHLPKEFYTTVINWNAWNGMSPSEQIANRKYLTAFECFFDANFKWENIPASWPLATQGVNNFYLGRKTGLMYYMTTMPATEPYMKFLSLECIGNRPMLETGASTGYFEDDIFRVKCESVVAGIRQEISQTLKLTRQVILN